MEADKQNDTIGSCRVAATLCSSPELLLLPDHILKRILQESGSAATLRFVCKAFAVAVAKTTTRVTLPRKVIGNPKLLHRVFSTFPDSNQVLLNVFVDGHHFPAEPTVVQDDATLVTGALVALATLSHPLISLSVRNLSCPMPLTAGATLAYLNSCGLMELDLQDASIQRAASDGASNLLRSHQPSAVGQLPGESLADSIRVRGAAMVQFACSLPSLRRLSLCSAAFAASDIAALSSLTQLEELSLVGAMECGGPSASASPEPALPQRPKLLDGVAAVSTYKQLLAALPNLRRLRLPMPVAIQLRYSGYRTTTVVKSDDEDNSSSAEDDAGSADFEGDQGDYWDFLRSSTSSSIRSYDGGSSCTSALSTTYTPTSVTGNVNVDLASRSWCFPPHLEELTIPLCSLNGPIFRAACEAYGGLGSTYGSEGTEAGGVRLPHRCLRALHVTCAPGYTVWEGSFLNNDRDFAALARLSSLESLHLCLELGGHSRSALRRGHLRRCFGHLRALHRMQDLRITETQQPTCFATRKSTGDKLSILSYLLDEVHEPMQPCVDFRLPFMPLLGDGLLSARPWSSRLLFPPQYSPPPPPLRGQATVSSPRSAPSLDSLLAHWPQLQTLAVCGQCVIRSSHGGQTRLVLPESVQQLTGTGGQQLSGM